MSERDPPTDRFDEEESATSEGGESTDSWADSTDEPSSTRRLSERFPDGVPEVRSPGWLTRRRTFVLVVILVVAALTIPGALLGPPAEDPPETPAAYSTEALAIETVESQGAVADEVTQQPPFTVVIDRSHANRFQTEDLNPLFEGIVAAGGEIVFHDRGLIEHELEDADALVVVDPAAEFSDDDVAAVDEFTDRGGHVLLLGQPNRQSIGILGGVSTDRSLMHPLASELGVGFGTDFLYDHADNDGNYRHVFATPTDEADDAYVEGVDRTTVYTGTTVHADGGTAILTTPETTQRSGTGETGEHAVVVVTDDGTTMAAGDASFLRTGRHGVADNEVFIARMVEFLADGG